MAASVAIARAGWRRLTPYEGAAAQALRRAWATAAATAAPTKPAENPGGGMPKAVRAVRGMPDYFGDDAAKLRAVENAGMRILQLAGYREARLPILEHTDVFEKPLGPTSDVVSKEMYTFQPNGSDDRLTMRPEGTAGLVRALIGRGLTGLGAAQRWFYCGPMFRHERPQKGRLRQFQQLGLELLSAGHWSTDVEAILLGAAFLEQLGVLQHVELRLNSIGDVACRREHRAALLAYLEHERSRLSPESVLRMDRGSPLRVLDSKDPRDRAVAAGAPGLSQFLSDDGRARFSNVQKALQALGVPFVVDPTLVRGLDYYGDTVFEFVSGSSHLGAQATVLAGGRYDDLVGLMGGRPTPAVGWAAGIDRLSLMVDPANARAADVGTATSAPAVALVALPLGDAPLHTALAIARALWKRGIPATLPAEADPAAPLQLADIGKQLSRASRAGISTAVVVGPDELARGQVQVKDMAANAVRYVRLADALEGDLNRPAL